MPTGTGHIDSYTYLKAASNFIAHPSQLYDRAHLQLGVAYARDAFVHPPSGLLPYLPLVPLVHLAGMPVAASAWSVIDLTSLIAAVIIWGRRLGLSWLALGAATLVISLSNSLGSEIDQGQINGLVLLLFALAQLRLPRLVTGLFLGLALAVKPVSFIALLVPILRRQPAITGAAIAPLVALNFPLILLIGFGPTLFYFGQVLPFFAEYPLRSRFNISLASVLQTWLGGGPLAQSIPYSVQAPQTLIAIAIFWASRLAAIAIWIRAGVDRGIDMTVAFALALATVPLSPTVWPHYLVYVFPLALATLAAPRATVRVGGALALLLMLWHGRLDGLWVGISVLWVAAAVFVFAPSGRRNGNARRFRRPAPVDALSSTSAKPNRS